jgi:hypothetical protein
MPQVSARRTSDARGAARARPRSGPVRLLGPGRSRSLIKSRRYVPTSSQRESKRYAGELFGSVRASPVCIARANLPRRSSDNHDRSPRAPGRGRARRPERGNAAAVVEQAGAPDAHRRGDSQKRKQSVSRLARCSEDLRRLLSLCAVAECGVIDESDTDPKIWADSMSREELARGRQDRAQGVGCGACPVRPPARPG